MTESPQRAILVDDHGLVRSGIRQMIESMTDDTIVVGETNSGRDALKLLDRLRIDIVITDLSMPDMDGIALIKAVRKRNPGVKCLVLSMHTNNEYVAAALQAGACGYLNKNASAEELLQALQAARAGEHYLHPSIAGSVVDMLRGSAALASPLDVLSERQREVLKLLAEGSNTREIAEKLSLSVKTVETHRAQLLERLDVRTIPDLVRVAIRHGLVEL
jgi:DNA-binding NarL/FixJ family response regulator